MGVPVIVRIAPELTGGTEVIGGHAGHDGRSAIVVQQKQLWAAPDLDRIGRDEDRQIVQQLQPRAAGVLDDLRSLSIEEVLLEANAVDRLGKFFPGLIEGGGLAANQVRRPTQIGRAVIAILERDEQSKVFQPVVVPLSEPGQRFMQLAARAGLKPIVRQVQQAGLEGPHGIVIDVFVRKRRAGHVSRREKAIFNELVGTDQQRVAAEAGQGGIRRIVQQRLSDRQELPPGLAGACQQVDPLVS